LKAWLLITSKRLQRRRTHPASKDQNAGLRAGGIGERFGNLNIGQQA
jgi:hypothetical protein